MGVHRNGSYQWNDAGFVVATTTEGGACVPVDYGYVEALESRCRAATASATRVAGLMTKLRRELAEALVVVADRDLRIARLELELLDAEHDVDGEV